MYKLNLDDTIGCISPLIGSFKIRHKKCHSTIEPDSKNLSETYSNIIHQQKTLG